MVLDPYNQTDHPDCKSRPDSGLSGITELDPGYITGVLLYAMSICQIWFCPVFVVAFCTLWFANVSCTCLMAGPLSSVWKEWIKLLWARLLFPAVIWIKCLLYTTLFSFVWFVCFVYGSICFYYLINFSVLKSFRKCVHDTMIVIFLLRCL